MDRNQESSPVSGGGGGQQQQQGPICTGCGAAIVDRFYLKALDKLWHEDCLKCACCDCRLGEVGSTCFTKANLILCRRDYLRLFGNMGSCTSCNKTIPAFELVMRANGNVYHLECFACQECNYRFCIGDRFYLCENRILCENDYEDRLLSGTLTGGQQHNNAENNIPHVHNAGSAVPSTTATTALRGCMPHPVIVPNHHLSCIVNEPMEMARNEYNKLI